MATQNNQRPVGSPSSEEKWPPRKRIEGPGQE